MLCHIVVPQNDAQLVNVLVDHDEEPSLWDVLHRTRYVPKVISFRQTPHSAFCLSFSVVTHFVEREGETIHSFSEWA